MCPFTRPSLFTAFTLLLAVRCARTFPAAPDTDDSSAEDSSSSFEAQQDESTSALNTEDSWSVEDSDIKSSELSTEAPWVDDNPKKIDLSLSDESPKPNKLDLLQEVYNNAGQFSNKLDKVVDVANNKITDWTQRINNYRSLIFGTGAINNNNNQWNGGGGDSWNNNYGGGGYGSNNQNGASIKSAYYTIKPFIIEIRDVLLKVFAFTSKFASQLFVSIPVSPKQSIMRGLGPRPVHAGPHAERFEPGKPSRAKTQPKGRKTGSQYTKGKGRRKGRVGAAGRRRSKTTESKVFETRAHVENPSDFETPAHVENPSDFETPAHTEMRVYAANAVNNPDAAPNYPDY